MRKDRRVRKKQEKWGGNVSDAIRVEGWNSLFNGSIENIELDVQGEGHEC